MISQCRHFGDVRLFQGVMRRSDGLGCGLRAQMGCHSPCEASSLLQLGLPLAAGFRQLPELRGYCLSLENLCRVAKSSVGGLLELIVPLT